MLSFVYVPDQTRPDLTFKKNPKKKSVEMRESVGSWIDVPEKESVS